VESIVDSGSSCTHNFAEGPGYKFTGITFVREPENGKLVKAGANRFVYTPNKGFTGKEPIFSRSAPSRARRRGARRWRLWRR
jgi:hypothetical protein